MTAVISFCPSGLTTHVGLTLILIGWPNSCDVNVLYFAPGTNVANTPAGVKGVAHVYSNFFVFVEGYLKDKGFEINSFK